MLHYAAAQVRQHFQLLYFQNKDEDCITMFYKNNVLLQQKKNKHAGQAVFESQKQMSIFAAFDYFTLIQ